MTKQETKNETFKKPKVDSFFPNKFVVTGQDVGTSLGVISRLLQPEGRYFRICGLNGICQNYSILLWLPESCR